MWTTESKKVELDFAITNTHTHAATQKVKLLSCKLLCGGFQTPSFTQVERFDLWTSDIHSPKFQ